jgi:hypothetical protein
MVSGHLHAPAVLAPAKLPLERRLIDLKVGAGDNGDVKILDLAGNRTLISRSWSQ